MKRAQFTAILKDLEKKMVILVGPRQTGKTWLSKAIAGEFNASVYLNYDQIEDRKMILAQNWLPTTELLVLDELHKMPDWKNYLKGLYDTKPTSLRILITGSARLDTFNHLGDSLAGRYYRHRLMPLSPAELKQLNVKFNLDHLIIRSGFPEPFLAENDLEANRWRLQYINSLLSTDVFEIDLIQNIKAMQLIFELLRHRVGSPVSYQSLARDAGVSANTVKKYIQILEALYIVFRVTPFAKNIARSLVKEPKLYFFDTGLVQGDEGKKLENLVAISLLKHVYAKVDYRAEPYQLHYLRTKDGDEVDFALVLDNTVTQIIEVKHSDHHLSKPLVDFHTKYHYPAIQLVKNLRQQSMQSEIPVLNAQKFLEGLDL